MTNVMPKTERVWIPVKNLSVIWVQAQRPYDERWAKNIADNFDPEKFDDILVTKPNGQGIYHIIEGQHRKGGLEMFAASMNKSGYGGDEQAPCRVIAEADPSRAAELFLGVNKGRKGVTPLAEFKVAVVAGRDPEKTIDKIVRKVGYAVRDGQDGTSISAVAALRMVYNRSGGETLAHTLEALKLLWQTDPKATSGHLIRGFGVFVHEFSPHINPLRLRKQIGERYSPWKVLTAAKARKESTQETMDEAVAEFLIREYNRGLKDEKNRLHRKS